MHRRRLRTSLSVVRGAVLVGLGVGIAFGLAACDVGEVAPGGDPSTAPDAGVDAAAADFGLTVSPGADTSLGTSIELTVALTSRHFAGAVALTASGAPPSWTVAILPPTVTLDDNGTASATVRITIPTNGDGAPAGLPVTILGQGAPGARAATAMVTVANVYTLAIGTPGATGQHFGMMAGGQLRLKRGAKLRIANTDSVAHRIHSDAGVQGFPHQARSMAAGAAYEVTLGATGSDLFYCHDHGQGTGAVRLTVE